MAYNILGQDDENLRVEVIEGELTTINIQPASFTTTGTAPVTSVNGETGDVVLDTDGIAEGTTNQYYTNTRVDDYLQSGSVTNINFDNGGAYLSYNADEATLDLTYDSTGVVLQLGQEQHIYAKTTEAISNGDVMMFAGAQGSHLLVSKADHSAPGFKPEYIVGVATEDAPKNDFVYVTTFGKVRDLDLSMYTEGDILYSDPTVAGGLTTTVPTAPQHVIQMAAVAYAHAIQGTIFVRPQHMVDTDEVPEGSTNLYFTEARVQSVIDANGADFATTAYVDAQDTTTLNSANAYADNIGDLVEAAANTYTDTAVSALVDSAPATLDTLNELAAALGDDPNFATSVTNLIAVKANSADLATVATTGAYSDLTGAPSNVSSFTNDAGYITGYSVTESDVTAHQSALTITESQISDLAHFSGDYNDLINQPSIPTQYTDADAISALENNDHTILTGNLTVNGDFVVLEQVKLNNFEFPVQSEGPTSTWTDNARTIRADYAFNNVLLNTNNPTITFDFSQFFSPTTNARRCWVAFHAIGGDGTVTFTDTILWDGGTQPNFAQFGGGSKVIVEFAMTQFGAILAKPFTVWRATGDYTDSHLGFYGLSHLGNVSGTTPTDGQALVWSDANSQWEPGTVSGSGGASALTDLTDVTVTAPSDGDILRYNGVAGEFQNTNLGLSLTPALSGPSTYYDGQTATITITNWASYQDANVWAQVIDSGQNVVIANSAITDNHDGTFSFTIPTAGTGYQLQVKVQDFGDLASDTATIDFDSIALFGWTARYIKIANFTTANDLNDLMYSDMRFYTGTGQTGTALPGDMTSDTTPAPFVITSSDTGYGSYYWWKMFDGSSSSAFWTLGTSSSVADTWLIIDLGAEYTINSMSLRTGNNYSDISNGFTIYTSDTGAFAGEEVERETLAHSDAINTTTYYN